VQPHRTTSVSTAGASPDGGSSLIERARRKPGHHTTSVGTTGASLGYKSDDNGGHAGVHHVGISSIVISMLIDDTLMLVTVKFRSVVGTRYSTLEVSMK